MLDVAMRQPQQHRSQASTGSILHAALELVSEGGLGAVTIAAVSRRSGQSNGAIYHRFGNRGGLVAAAQGLFLDRVEASTRDAFDRARAEPDDRTAIAVIVTSYVTVFTRHRRSFRAFMLEGPADPQLLQRGRATSHRIQDWCTEWIADRFGASGQQSAGAVYLVLAVALTRMVFDDDVLLAQQIGERQLVETVVSAVLGVLADQSDPQRPFQN
jgi:AcrR family transcriptional regulator